MGAADGDLADDDRAHGHRLGLRAGGSSARRVACCASTSTAWRAIRGEFVTSTIAKPSRASCSMCSRSRVALRAARSVVARAGPPARRRSPTTSASPAAAVELDAEACPSSAAEVSSPGLDRPLKRPPTTSACRHEVNVTLKRPSRAARTTRRCGRRRLAPGVDGDRPSRRWISSSMKCARRGWCRCSISRAGHAGCPARSRRAEQPRGETEVRHDESRNADAGGRHLAREERRTRRGLRRGRGGARPGHQEAARRRGRHPRLGRPRQRRLRDLPPLARGAQRGRPADSRRRDAAVRGAGADPRHRGRRLHRAADRIGADRPHRREGRQAGDPAEDPRRRARAAAQRLPVARREDLRRHRQAPGQGRHHRRVRPRRRAPEAQRDDPEGKPAHRATACAPSSLGVDPTQRGAADHAVAHRARLHDRTVPPGSARDRAGPAGDQELRPRPRLARQDRRGLP